MVEAKLAKRIKEIRKIPVDFTTYNNEQDELYVQIEVIIQKNKLPDKAKLDVINAVSFNTVKTMAENDLNLSDSPKLSIKHLIIKKQSIDQEKLFKRTKEIHAIFPDWTKYAKQQKEISDKICAVLDLYEIPDKAMFDAVHSVSILLAQTMAENELS